jgi:hypothetical protein
MTLPPGSRRREPGRIRAEIAWCLLGLAVFLLLPTLGYHHYGPFYRPPEVRQSAGRHSFLAAPVSEREIHYDTGRSEPVAHEAAARPSLSPALHTDVPPPIPIARCLMRLKLAGPTGSDPDIFA